MAVAVGVPKRFDCGSVKQSCRVVGQARGSSLCKSGVHITLLVVRGSLLEIHWTSTDLEVQKYSFLPIFRAYVTIIAYIRVGAEGIPVEVQEVRKSGVQD